jgi:hypothetical protein
MEILGLSPGTQIVGFPPAIVVPPSTEYAGPVSAAAQAKIDLTTAYNFAGGESCSVALPGNAGGLMLTPGVYCIASAEDLIGTLTLDEQGNPDAVFVFQIGSTLNVTSGSLLLFLPMAVKATSIGRSALRRLSAAARRS